VIVVASLIDALICRLSGNSERSGRRHPRQAAIADPTAGAAHGRLGRSALQPPPKNREYAGLAKLSNQWALLPEALSPFGSSYLRHCRGRAGRTGGGAGQWEWRKRGIRSQESGNRNQATLAPQGPPDSRSLTPELCCRCQRPLARQIGVSWRFPNREGKVGVRLFRLYAL